MSMETVEDAVETLAKHQKALPPTIEGRISLGLELERLPRRTPPVPGSHEGVTRIVGPAVYTSYGQYKRARALVLAARSPIRPPSVVAAARKALAEAEGGTITISAAYDRLRAAEEEWAAEQRPDPQVTGYDAKGLPTTPPPQPNARGSKARKLRIEWVKALGKQGAASDEIAVRLGIGQRAVWQIVRDEGLVIPADKAMARTPRKAFDPARAMTAIATDLDALVWSLDRIDPGSLDPAQAADWAAQLHAHALTIRRVSRRISPKKESNQ